MTEPKLKPRSEIHFARKLWHILGVTIIIILYHNLSRPACLQTFTLIAAVFVWIDVYRQRSERVNKIVISMFRPFMRDYERHALAGTTYLFVGVLIIVALFPRNVVTLALLFLGIADPIASYFGIRYGKDRLWGKKSLQGTLAAFFACTIVSAVYYLAHSLMTERLLIVSILSGFMGALSEVIPIGKLDDNLVLPVLSSGLLSILFYLFGGL